MIDPFEVMGNLTAAAAEAQHELRKARLAIASLSAENEALRKDAERLAKELEECR